MPASPWLHRAAWVLGLALVLLGVWARCSGWRSVFVGDEVELVPADSHYYVRFARLQLAAFPRFVTFDPFVNFPEGASILWPPLHTLFVALAIAGPGSAELGAAWVGPGLSALLLAAVGLTVARFHGRGPALAALALLALTPTAVESGALGNADHHVHEPFLALLAPALFGYALASGRRGPALAAGLVVGFGRLLTTTAFTLLPCLAVGGLAAALIASRRETPERAASALKAAGAGAVGSLALGVLLFGHPTRLDYESLTAFHPILALALFCGAVGLVALRARDKRGAVWLAVALLAGLALSGEFLRAMGHLGRGDPMMATVVETEPLLKDPKWALELLGPLLLALPFAAWGAWRLAASGSPVAWPALATAGLLTAASAVQARFAQGLSGAATCLVVLTFPALMAGLPAVWQRVAKVAGAMVCLLLLGPLFPQPARPPPDQVRLVRPTLRWMKEHTPPAADDPYRPSETRYAVVADHELGHFVTLWAERPEVASTFFQASAHVAGNARAAQVLAERDDAQAFRLAQETGARYVLATPSVRLVGHPPDAATSGLVGWLLDETGMAVDDRPASAHFQLVYDSLEQRRKTPVSAARVFQVVPGAVLTGHGPPGETVTASLRLRNHHGRTFEYVRKARVDPSGRFELRVAYPTEGTPWVAPHDVGGSYALSLGTRTLSVTVPRAAVESGANIEALPDSEVADSPRPGP
ncbi:STT3 domain-containing protein [Hyalangium rubrum]|uniref:Peptide transporter n=1 Tax=Hyalangium rubrum TaxID=3103134 RepID=A0ABU5HCM0_9BACT|nr:STT3 domain-containing protein [Hyalangium sp. s54d21]MDY7230578.1 peptide transporter [Hyalangium sp. s54d21]